ncbi:MAG TPA: cytochrome c biogenesis protein CcsA [Anaeromyxobacteraceae bacterium]|nr:cytochrome c biogenesis protein CcsA [Anaeromyxobacteraceae bacterium]
MKLLETLASLKIAVVLLVLLLLGLAAGTIVESSSGAEVAGRLVYYSWWFLLLQAVFAVNVTASIIVLFPWGKQRVGYIVTHGSLLLILVGALLSFFFKTEGQIGLWEGETGSRIENHDREGRVIEQATLPFSVRLLQFRVDHYPGTMRPSGFRSEVLIIEPDGKVRPASIWMNHELEVHGWRLFQSSYRQEGGRQASIFSVSKDPGQPVVFLGYGLLVIGMCIVLGTRISQARARAARDAAVAAKAAGRALAVVLALASLGGAASARADELVESLRRLPVQHDGRVMPLDTLAREAVWQVTGSRSFEGNDPVALVVAWTFNPQASANAPLVAVGSAEIARAAGLPEGARHASFNQLVSSQRVLGLMEEARRAEAEERPRHGAVSDAEKLEQRLLTLQKFLSRDAIRTRPNPADPNARWGTPELTTPAALAALATGPRPEGWPSPSAIEREITYNAVRPTRIAWIVLLAAFLLSIAAWGRKNRVLDGLALLGLVAGLGVMTWGIGTRWIVADRIPAANMYESLLFLAWGVGLFAVVAFAVMRNRLVVLNACAMAALTMALTDLLPIDGFIHPVAPVLAGTPWLAIHVPIIMVSYSVLALGVVVAHMQIGFTIFAPRKAETIARMADLLYWYMMVGSILLITGILTGSAWAASSWGRYWGWDPKEVWSLVAFLAYAAIIHARWDNLIGAFGTAAISIVAFQTILMTYLGVNFVLGVGLHSYGFGDSPVLAWMILVAVVEAAFLALGWAAHRRQGAGPARAA